MKALIFFLALLFLPFLIRCQALILTEIMADPTPGRGILPAVEYLELVNPSPAAVELEGMAIATDGRPARPLGRATLPPGAVLILCDPADAAALAPFGQVLGVDKFPTLRNDGDEILLIAANGDTLLRQFYQPGWHRDPSRAAGGWSLELLDPDLPANCDLNWASSQDERGGSPGSYRPRHADLAALPALLRAFPDSPVKITLFFSGSLDPAAAANAEFYLINPFVPVQAASPGFPAARAVTLELAEPITAGRRYTLTLSSSLRDCLGRPLSGTDSASFALPANLASGDLIINELLFDPPSGGAPFVELLNRSEKTVNLRELSLVNHRSTSSQRSAMIREDFLLLPGDYAVVTPSLADLMRDFQVAKPAAVLQNDLPALGRDRGNISLHFAGLTIDSFDYDEALHSSFLPDSRGVSLERIDPSEPTQSPANWHSAAQTAGFATPTARNSQAAGSQEATERIFLPYQVFTPDGDGFQDYLLISYQLDRPGYFLQLWVFDETGRPVRILSEGELSGTRGKFKWDGTTDTGTPAAPGMYIIAAALLSPRGQTTRTRKVAVLAPAPR